MSPPAEHIARGSVAALTQLSREGWPRGRTRARVLAIGKGRRWARVDVCGAALRLVHAREWHDHRGSWAELEGHGYRLALDLGAADGSTGTNGRLPATVDRADVRLGARIADLVRAWPALLGETPDVVVERSLHPYHDARYCARVRGLSSGMEFYRADGRTPRAAVRALWRKLSGAERAGRDGSE